MVMPLLRRRGVALPQQPFSAMSRIRAMITRSVIAAAIIVSLAGLSPAMGDTRIALVIGNGAYRNVPRLPNPPLDAAAVAAALKRSGFDTINATDLDERGMEEASIRFARAARTADVALFYYSGHALQFDGVNYLVPVDSKLEDEADLRRLIRVDQIVADLQQAKNLRILVLDSCRNNPFAEDLRRSIGTTRAVSIGTGLAKIDAPVGMIVSYATQAGRTAADGEGHNSPYTTAFLNHIEKREEIGMIFREISEDVYQSTGHNQLPELSLSMIGRFYLHGEPAAQGRADGTTEVGKPQQAALTPPKAPLTVDELRVAAESGDAAAQNSLGEIYATGRGVILDRGQAQVWFRKAAEQGYATAQSHLGEMYVNGEGVVKDVAEGASWLRKAAEQGDVDAEGDLGMMYASGAGVPQDDVQAASWFRKASEQGNAPAQVAYGWLFMDGRGVGRDETKAVALFRKAAEQGDAAGKAGVGFAYLSGRGVAKDPQQAITWYRKAAEQGYGEGQADLGWVLMNDGVERDQTEAVEWFRKAAAQGNLSGKRGIGTAYYKGRGVTKDPQQAVKWMREAAEQGFVPAQADLGDIYNNAKDYAQAITWYQKAAEQGHAAAQSMLGVFYLAGRGTRKNYEQALLWFQKAADRSNSNGQVGLGFLYQHGLAVRQDYRKAAYFYREAVSHGNDAAEQYLREIPARYR